MISDDLPTPGRNSFGNEAARVVLAIDEPAPWGRCFPVPSMQTGSAQSAFRPGGRRRDSTTFGAVVAHRATPGARGREGPRAAYASSGDPSTCGTFVEQPCARSIASMDSGLVEADEVGSFADRRSLGPAVVGRVCSSVADASAGLGSNSRMRRAGSTRLLVTSKGNDFRYVARQLFVMYAAPR